MLTPPINISDHVRGPANAPVTLVEFGDYECAYCGTAYPIVEAVRHALKDSLLLAFRHFPLTTAHPHALAAAEAAEAAAAQGQFWQMHARLYENQEALADEDLLDHAAAIGLSLAKFVEDMREHRYLPRVRANFSSGARSGVNGTPSFFINGIRYDGLRDLQSMLAAIETAAAAA
jgi:protein-disulfide isomerase